MLHPCSPPPPPPLHHSSLNDLTTLLLLWTTFFFWLSGWSEFISKFLTSSDSFEAYQDGFFLRYINWPFDIICCHFNHSVVFMIMSCEFSGISFTFCFQEKGSIFNSKLRWLSFPIIVLLLSFLCLFNRFPGCLPG